MDNINNNITNKGVMVQEPTFLSMNNMHYRFAIATGRFGTSNGMPKATEPSIFPILMTDSECAYHYFDGMSTPEAAVDSWDESFQVVRVSEPLPISFMADMDYTYDRFSGMAVLSTLPLGSNNMEKIPGTNVRKLKMK